MVVWVNILIRRLANDIAHVIRSAGSSLELHVTSTLAIPKVLDLLGVSGGSSLSGLSSLLGV
jgi:hypothetical protein